MTTARCKHGAHVLDDPPCPACVAEVEAFRAQCAAAEGGACPVCQDPMHPHMAEKYGGCTVDHGEIAELRAEVTRLRDALRAVVGGGGYREDAEAAAVEAVRDLAGL